MNEDRWQRVEEVFHRAADLAPAEREAFLESACAGDDRLRHEVESLLANDEASGEMLGTAVARAIEKLPDEPPQTGEELIGKTIGPYQVMSLIGKGGMGMVFKARDTQLNRTVAIKALPMERLADPDRKRRFLQEAQAASALNHPNIVTVHGITRQSGTDFIVMEYVTGKTLDQLIPRKGMALKKALRYGLEIAEAVAAAHAAGIVHRDIKPSNIMVTDEGRVKVLDFGLAKLTEREPSAEEPVEESLVTKGGMVLGTAAYMSPEQAAGKRVDARSDVFSFGAVFYEMVTGRRAFAGKSVISTLGSVMHDEPAPTSAVIANLPPELEWVITWCLKKEPARRIQHMVDVKLALAEVIEAIEAPLPETGPKSHRAVWLALLLGVLVIALGAGAWLGRQSFQKTPITFERLTFRRGDVLSARFAPSGGIVYAADWEGALPTLFSAQPGNREARNLGLPSGNVLSVSSLGEMAILTGSSDPGTYGTLAQVPLAGGAPREILENVVSADWSPDGKALAVVRTVERRHRVEYPIGTVLYETESARPPLYVRVAPKGGRVAFFDFSGDYALNLVDAGGKRRVLSTGWRAIAGVNWSPDGKEIWFSGARPGGDPALYAVDLSGRERLLTQIAGWGVLHDVARDGRMLLSNVDSRLGIRYLGAGAKEERDLGWLDASRVRDISNDGKELLFEELSSGEGRNSAIYLRRTDGSPAVRLGFGNQPSLSPDGKWVICVRRDKQSSKLLLLPTGAGEGKLLATGGIQPEAPEWFPNGKRILFRGAQGNQPRRSYEVDLEGGAARAVTAADVIASSLSPDSRSALDIRGGKILLRSISDGRETAIGPAGPGVSVIRWSADGRYIFLERNEAENHRAVILRMDVRSGRSEVWRELKTPEPGAVFYSTVRLSADGQSYAYSFQRDLATLYLVKGVK
ncbi:MAG TPA: protein kinase [Bryobacteraceae bacterium]|nr:protein kinase [Bryobacteraceae bacterium]